MESCVIRAVAAIVLLSSLGNIRAQGHFLRTITFDGSPVIPPGTGVLVTYYYEDSMVFRPITPDEDFSRAGGGREAFPENGTAYILQGAFNSISGSRGGTRFGLDSVDLSEFSIVYQEPWTVQFVGYRFDGSIVTSEFTVDGAIDGNGPLPDFQTFYLDSRFDDLVKFDVPSHRYAMDNLVFFDVVPEPSSCGLLVMGGLLIAARCLRLRKSG